MEGEVEKIFTQTHMGLEGAEIKKKKWQNVKPVHFHETLSWSKKVVFIYTYSYFNGLPYNKFNVSYPSLIER